jgi:hypothetical protein
MDDNEERITRAWQLWSDAKSIDDTVAETYLRDVRLLTSLLPRRLRYHPECWHRTRVHLPALIARIDTEGVGFTGIQRTYLRANGSGKARVEPVRASLGVVKGGAVRLRKAGPELALAEGVETALSFEELTGIPCWAACGAKFFEHVILPELPLAKVVILAVDNDKAGQAGAERAAIRFFAEGRQVKFAHPRGGNDFNDVLREVNRD